MVWKKKGEEFQFSTGVVEDIVVDGGMGGGGGALVSPPHNSYIK